MNEPLRIGVAGLGTVGAGVVGLLERQRDLLQRRCGRALQVTAVSARNRHRDRGVPLSGYQWHDDPVALARSDGVDVVVELIGGENGPAKAVVDAAIAQGRHVVTANKAMIAHHGYTLAQAAEQAGVCLNFEAAVAGGIPVVKALREGLAANAVQRVYGILNGTCNYILTQMRDTGRPFEEILAEAQALGFAEADPSFDVDGVDAAHKLAILASLAFGCRVEFAGVHIDGIRDVEPLDIAFARDLGYRIKLLAIARPTPLGIEQRVHPCMVPEDAAIANVDGVLNAVVAEGDSVGRTVFEGPGAGEGPTASAVVADLIDIARGTRLPTFSVPARDLEPMPAAPMSRHRGSYYVRLMVLDQPGVIAGVSAVLRDEAISIESLLQRGRAATKADAVPVVMITHETEEAAMLRALERMGHLESVRGRPRMIRIEMP